MVQELLQNIEISEKKTVFYNKHNSLFEHFLEKEFFSSTVYEAFHKEMEVKKQ